ncbi:hypothetical protein [Nocardia sp. NPDC059239]|uniref:hypothetical protein n=1 Tax=Nocardia sp. NPDC059239 TaxID=3346785 RepID=UPI0036C45D62
MTTSGDTRTVVIWADRRSDTTAYLFTDRDVAEEWAWTKGREYDRHGNYTEKTYPNGELRITYGTPSEDYLAVSEAVVDQLLPRRAS